MPASFAGWSGRVTRRFRDFNADLLVTSQQHDDAVGKAVRIAEILHRAYYNTDDALSILRTMREPDPVMAAAGDPDVWERMVEAALSVERAAGN